jgi:hypothetical protein
MECRGSHCGGRLLGMDKATVNPAQDLRNTACAAHVLWQTVCHTGLAPCHTSCVGPTLWVATLHPGLTAYHQQAPVQQLTIQRQLLINNNVLTDVDDQMINRSPVCHTHDQLVCHTAQPVPAVPVLQCQGIDM